MQILSGNGQENDAKRKHSQYTLRGGLELAVVGKDGNRNLTFVCDSGWVQIYFILDRPVTFSFPNTTYTMGAEAGECCFMYQPELALRPAVRLDEGSQIVAIFGKLEDIHKTILGNQKDLSFFSQINESKKYYKKDSIKANLELNLREVLGYKQEGSIADIFRFGKVLEIFAQYFSAGDEEDAVCPYLKEEDSLMKIKKAKEVLIEKMEDPPTIEELSKLVDLKEYKLKEGFKGLYGTTVFAYLQDYKMNLAKSKLDEGGAKIQDVAYEIGYNNSTHFIAAFKKKFGVTPKQYVKRL